MNPQQPTWPRWQWPGDVQAMGQQLPQIAAPLPQGGPMQQGWQSAPGVPTPPSHQAFQAGASTATSGLEQPAGAASQPAQPQGTQQPAGSQSVQQAGMGAAGASEAGRPVGPTLVPLVDMVETSEEIVVLVDMPGFEEEHIRIQADDQNLVVTGERTGEFDDEEVSVHMRERSPRVQRSLALPIAANVDDASATHENGVCRITLPKSEEEDKRTIAFQ